MTATFMNAASVLSIGIFFTLIVAGLTHSLPAALYDGLTRQDVPSAAASGVAGLPALGVLFAAFLGYNPMRSLLGPLSGQLPPAKLHLITGQRFFPQLITHPFHDGLVVTFWFAIGVSVVAAAASAFTGGPRTARPDGTGAAGEAAAAVLEPPAAELTPAPAAETAAAGAADRTAIAGTVTRPDGAPAPGVTVTALNAASVVAGSAVTGADGRYRLTVPGPGHYVVVAAGQRTRAVRLDPRATGDAPVLLRIGEPA
jgi:hypothetical protein